MSASVSGGRSEERPDGSPIFAVTSPMMKTTWWPIRWNRLAMMIGTEWPRWTSGEVGSMPYFTMNGRPAACAAVILSASAAADGIS